MVYGQSWQLAPWRKYLIDNKIKCDTCRVKKSIMGSAFVARPYEPRLFRTVTSSAFIPDVLPTLTKKRSNYDPNPRESIFAEQDRQAERERLRDDHDTWGEFVVNTLLDLFCNITLKK